jgi:MHS family proline/betaine transporter-like MFS transporter
MRPVGGLTIGYVGDRYGRKKALVLSLFLMAFPTALMGCLPTYDQVGALSTILLVVCRLLQGMSVGGQLPASLIYTVEIRPKAHWGYYGALVMMASNCGTLLGNLVGAFMRAVLTEEQLIRIGWRIPFLSGLLIAFVAIYLRDHGVDHNPNAGEYDDDDESRNNVSKQDDVSKHLLSEVFKKENLPALGSATLTPMLWGAGFYTSFVWMAIYMKVLCNPPYEHAFWINAGALLFGVILPLPLTGMLSDTLGRDKTMGFGVAGLAILGPLMIKVISAGNAVTAFFAQCTLGLFLSLFGGPMNGE